MSSDWWGIAWLAILLVINAFFVGAEFSVLAARRAQIEVRAEAGSRSARTALWAMEHATDMLATCQLGITVCSLLILNVSEPAIHHLLEVPLAITQLPEEVVGTTAFIITLIVVSFLHVVLGEMVPKNLSFAVPDRAVLILAPPLVAVFRVVSPIVWLLNTVANAVLRLFRVEPKNEAASAFTYEEVATIVETSTREGVITDDTGTLSNAFEFTEKNVEDVMIATGELIALPAKATRADLERAVAQHGFSRYPLMDEAGQLTGYVHLKDVLGLNDEAYDKPIPRRLIRELARVTPGTPLEDALATMRSAEHPRHVARVRDMYTGGTLGVLFLEDIIEVLVGEVQDATRRQP